MHQAVENGVSKGVIADAGVPLIGRKLADHDGGHLAMAIVHDFHQIIAMGGL